MAEIPEDVMKAARECADLCLYTTDDRMAVHIASAIMAERERCLSLVQRIRFMDEFDRHALAEEIARPGSKPMHETQWSIEQTSSAASSSPERQTSEQERDLRQHSYSADGA